MAKLILSGYIEVPDFDLAAVQKELPVHIDLTRQEEGCIVFEVAQNKAYRNRFDVYEEFSDKLAFERHQLRVKRSVWGEITSAVSRHYEITLEEEG